MKFQSENINLSFHLPLNLSLLNDTGKLTKFCLTERCSMAFFDCENCQKCQIHVKKNDVNGKRLAN